MPDTDQVDALQLAKKDAAAGNLERAKFWLDRAGYDPSVPLMKAQLYARSRSTRASKRALGCLNWAAKHADALDARSRQQIADLFGDLKTRNYGRYEPDIACTAYLKELHRYYAMLNDEASAALPPKDERG